MKRILAVFLAITLMGSLTACGTGKKDETKAGQETKATQEIKAESKEGDKHRRGGSCGFRRAG